MAGDSWTVKLRWFFCAAILVSVSPALSCRCDFTNVKRLYKNPQLAKAAFIAKSEGTGKNRVFHVTHSWTPFKEGISSPEKSSCGLKTEIGKTYLVYSLNSVDFVEKRGIGFTVCDSVALELEDAEPVIEKLASRKSENDLSANPSWFYCTRKAECIKAKGVCSEAVGLNRKYRERFYQWTSRVASIVNCVESPAEATGKVFCRENFCHAEVDPEAHKAAFKKDLEKLKAAGGAATGAAARKLPVPATQTPPAGK